KQNKESVKPPVKLNHLYRAVSKTKKCIMRNSIYLSILLALLSCNKNDDDIPTPADTMYFPSNTSTTWDTSSLSSIEWNESAVQQLKDFLTQQNTKAFLILVNGRIVMEEYFDGHTATEPW